MNESNIEVPQKSDKDALIEILDRAKIPYRKLKSEIEVGNYSHGKGDQCAIFTFNKARDLIAFGIYK